MRKFLLFLLLPLVALVGCSQKEETKLLSASIYPLVWTVKNLYPDYEVYQIIKPGSNPHLYDLSPKDALQIERSKKVFLIGNLEPFAEKVEPQKRVEVYKLLGLDEASNPHYWLSPKRWLLFVEKLQNLEGLKPAPEKWKKLVEDLKNLDREYESELSRLKGVKIVMVHPAFYWTCRDYHLEVLAVLEPKAGLGISVRTFSGIADRIRTLKEGKVLVLYSSNNPKAAEVARKLSELSPRVVPVALNTLVSRTEGDYVKLMEENLKRILKAASR